MNQTPPFFPIYKKSLKFRAKISGTTGLACKRLERNFIGIESEKEYFQTAKKRLNLF
ncbi:DNA methyltransferase [Helicobacter pylori]|uniref:DNA methyltransferase n=1 Tax=Helicobacter pylori TaxID=210 RepID=UPI0022AB7978|nr:DNA methyltransferase [Helicobacter pylori]